MVCEVAPLAVGVLSKARLNHPGAKRAAGRGQSMPALLDISDVNLFRYRDRIVDFDAEISHSAFDFRVTQRHAP